MPQNNAIQCDKCFQVYNRGLIACSYCLASLNKHGGKRQGAGRKAIYTQGTTRLYIPNELLCQVKAMIEAHKNAIQDGNH